MRVTLRGCAGSIRQAPASAIKPALWRLILGSAMG
jgi:hypothetical protein